jgi:hypothetical protein
MMKMTWTKRGIRGKTPVVVMIVALPGWEGSKKRRRREGTWEMLLANPRMMILKQWTLSSLKLELGWAKGVRGVRRKPLMRK